MSKIEFSLCRNYCDDDKSCIAAEGEMPSKAELNQGKLICGVSTKGRPPTGRTSYQAFIERQRTCNGYVPAIDPIPSNNGQKHNELSIIPSIVTTTDCGRSYYTDGDDHNLRGMKPARYLELLNQRWGDHKKHAQIPPYETLPLYPVISPGSRPRR